MIFEKKDYQTTRDEANKIIFSNFDENQSSIQLNKTQGTMSYALPTKRRVISMDKSMKRMVKIDKEKRVSS